MKNTRGFTLVELSIVLVIIAFIVAGIIIGEDMVRSSQLQSVIGEVQHYTQAIDNFRDKYQALPGDFAGAEAIWGSDSGCPGTAYTTTPHAATCNGNGDGIIEGGNEGFRAWQQLADAGMIDGSYVGMTGNVSSMYAVVGVNVPASRLSGAGYNLMSEPLFNGDANNWPHTLPTTHEFRFGGQTPGYDTYLPTLAAAEALSIDQKVDDGLPASGHVLPFKSSVNPGCTKSDGGSGYLYDVSSTGRTCSLDFLLDF